MGRLFGIVVEKGAELPKDDPRRKFKGRVVFQGNRVVNQNFQAAMFQDLGSSPASIEAGKAVDCVGCLSGNSMQQADAEQAYIQADLRGTPTWIALPEEAWPSSWKNKGYRRPVVQLRKALYGHPDSGTYWEVHCNAALKRAGFIAVRNWSSCFMHKGLGLMLTVYVDDFKMSGPEKNLQKGWALFRQELNLEDPAPANLYLGCLHRPF